MHFVGAGRVGFIETPRAPRVRTRPVDTRRHPSPPLDIAFHTIHEYTPCIYHRASKELREREGWMKEGAERGG